MSTVGAILIGGLLIGLFVRERDIAHDESGMLHNLNRCEYVGLWKNGEGQPLAQVTAKHAVIAWTTSGADGRPYVLWQGDDPNKAMASSCRSRGKVT